LPLSVSFRETAMTKTLAEIAEVIATLNDGSYELDWACAEEYDTLTYEQQQKVQNLVYSQLSPCDHCGWHFMIEDMETIERGELICWQCEQNREEDAPDY
jgi:formylmethanofuran dehydrogenase subunit E